MIFYFILDPLPCYWWNVSVWVDIPPDFKIISEFQALATKKTGSAFGFSPSLLRLSFSFFFPIWSTNQGAGTGGLSERENIQGESEAACVHLSACVCIFGVRTRVRVEECPAVISRCPGGHFIQPWMADCSRISESTLHPRFSLFGSRCSARQIRTGARTQPASPRLFLLSVYPLLLFH